MTSSQLMAQYNQNSRNSVILNNNQRSLDKSHDSFSKKLPKSPFAEEEDDIEDNSLMLSLKQSGFGFLIDFKELIFDQKSDYVGSGGYGDVFVGKWLGAKVAIKKFGKKYTSRKAMKEFIKEIEVVHGLRHPGIILYMGVSFDAKNQYYMVTDFVQRGSLFEIVHQKKIA